MKVAHMRKIELDLKLKLFKYQVLSLIEFEEKLVLINEELSGNIHAPKILGYEEAKVQRGTRIFKNNILECLEDEKYYIEKRNASLFAVREIMFYLQELDDVEIDLLERVYWFEQNYDRIAEVYSYDKSTICRKKEAILQKLQRVSHRRHI
ncbi:hypothetical protein SAMN02745191_1003 [Anaerorhabdus furcosa]|uniref:Phage transcriptional activator, RinA family n=2 Tax=Anaerorhabdus furcosa TaxID=118967 RepID=A0A1T4LQJ2_9FIRM|nr:hypothetical protein SAMN02745191_1003 [Anaerorhabdus furcosa]